LAGETVEAASPFRRSEAVRRTVSCTILVGFILGVADMEFEVWARDGGNAIGYVLILATEAKRQEMRRAAPGAMQECIATFEAESRDEATGIYDAMYEDLAVTWEAKNSDLA
jgi:hypothetical protein